MFKLSQPVCRVFVAGLMLSWVAGTASAQQNATDGQLPAVDRRQASKLVMVQLPPEYPPVAKVNLIQGCVQLELSVNAQGNVDSAHVLQGNALLAQAALEASRHWVFHPLETSTGPTGFRTRVLLKFELHNASDGIIAGLTPRAAERDFLRQVKPSQAMRPAIAPATSSEFLRLRVLLSDQGKVMDFDGAAPESGQRELVMECLRSWSFQPARWGNLPVASYLDVQVPLALPSVSQLSLVKSGGP